MERPVMRIIGGIARGTKLYTLEGENTRPTLDRVKESLFNIIQGKVQESVFLDLFSGSGAIGLEAVSRGAKKTILCDNSKDAIRIINKNVEKTHMQDRVELYNTSFSELLENRIKFKIDIVYIDPPYKTDYIYKSLKILEQKDILNKDNLIILETDEKERILKEIEGINFKIVDQRKYGRANLIFLNKEF